MLYIFDRMSKSTITIDVHLDEGRVPDKITWNASDTTIANEQVAKAMMLAFWDGAEKTALRIDLWTKQMLIDEMADFYYQTLMSMAESYNRATNNEELVNDMKNFAQLFYKKFHEQQAKKQQTK